MADTKISAETAAAALDGTELYEGVQGGANVKVTGAQIKTLAQTGLAAVATSGSAADLSAGTLLAARMPALTGDVTSTVNTVATTIAANAVTYAKFQTVAGLSVVGNGTNATAAAAAITGAANGVLRVSGTTLAFGAVDVSTAMITGRLPYANLTQGSALSVLGVTGNATADNASMVGTADQVLRVTTAGTALAFGTIATGGITAAAVTYAKIQNVAASSLLGNATGSPAAPAEITLAGGLAFSGSTLTAAGALTPTSVASTGAITSSSASAGIGYATGAGGAATQGTSRTTTVVLSKTAGAITMFSAAGSATWATFTVTNTQVAATDTIVLSVKSATNLYMLSVTAVAAGSFNISFATTGGTATDAPVINFAVVKAVTA